MIVLIPKLITSADKNPAKYNPKEIAKINMVVVPGHGMIPAEMMSAKSVELFSTLHEAQEQVLT